MMMVVKRLFVDTNILVYATETRSPYRIGANRGLSNAQQQGFSLVISAQVLREYLAVTTRASLSNTAISFTDILENIRLFRRKFQVVEDNTMVLNNLLVLLESIPTAGKQVYDANIVATMQAHGIRSLLTHNTSDFSRFSHLIDLLDI